MWSLASPIVQRKPEGRAPTRAPAKDHNPHWGTLARHALAEPGRPLAGAHRQRLEAGFGQDLGAVQIHDGPAAAQASAGINAQAFTLGQHVFFSAGRFSPGSQEGDRLLAHEVTHTVQQRGAEPAVQRACCTSQPGDRAEQEADQIAGRVTSGQPAGTIEESPTGTVMRQLDAGVPSMDAGVPDATVPAPPGPVDAGDPVAGVPMPAPAPAVTPPAVPAPVPAPVDPHACSTPEEEALKARFRASTRVLTNHIPSTGFGIFDATYWPSASLMYVRSKTHFTFVPADNTPDPMTLLGMLMAGQNVMQFFWTPAEEATFKQDYQRRIALRWSFAHVIRCTKPCWPFFAHPLVVPIIVDDPTMAHYRVTVHKTPGPGFDYKSGTGDPVGTQGTADLWSSDVRESPSFNSRTVARNERRRLDRALAAASPIRFNRGESVVHAASMTRLRTLAAAMKAKNPSDPAIPILVDGFASAEGVAGDNLRLSQDRADAVSSVLSAEGVPQLLLAVGLGVRGAPNDAAQRRVRLRTDTTFETTYAGNRYSVAEHEFGHMVGLPDEYLNSTTGLWGAQQTAFVNLVNRARVANPDRWGVTTSSQMSAGVDVLPRHYATFWEALGRMTQPELTEADWQIG